MNYTAGMPLIRTSPDHGTAYDIAGKGVADAHSFEEAVFTAIKIFKNRVENLDLIAHKLEVRKIAQNVEDEDLPEGEE